MNMQTSTKDNFNSLPLPFQRFHKLHFPSHSALPSTLQPPPHVALIHSWLRHPPASNNDYTETNTDAWWRWWYANGGVSEGNPENMQDGTVQVEEGEEEEELVEGDDENVEIHLTEEMIEMFKHSEDWKRERATILERERLEEQKESEPVFPEPIPSATATPEEIYGRRNRDAIAAKENYLNWIHGLDSGEDGNKDRWSQKSKSKRIVWPVLPIRC